MTTPQYLLLFFAGTLASALNAVAGGGSFISFPVLLFTGVAPVAANATSTLALWFGTAASGGAYRSHLNIARRIILPLILASMTGGLIGALLLIHTPAKTFLLLIPWLLLAATLLFIFGRRFTRFLAGGITGEPSNLAVAGATGVQLLVAIYGGYFGGGIGIMNLAMFSAMGMTNIHAMNALKVVLAGSVNGVANVTFILNKAIFWPQALVMTAGALVGGFFSAHYAQRLPHAWVRIFVIAVGLSMTAYFFYRGYH